MHTNPDARRGVTLVIVPGQGNSGRGHWQTLLEQSWPGAIRVTQKNWQTPIRWQWVRALDRLVRDARGPMILVGHSAGTMTIVEWALRARRHAGVLGALLVAPPDMEAPLPGMPSRWLVRLVGWAPIKKFTLPFKSIVVASSNDPMCSISRAREFAAAWGSAFVDLGPAGHINTLAGFGPFPQIERLIEELVRE